MEIGVELLKKKKSSSVWSSYTTPGYFPKELQDNILQRFLHSSHMPFFIKNMLFENALSVLSLICNYIISMYVSVVADAEWESFNTLPYSYV